MTGDKSERGRPASFDPKSGAVHGSGSGAGGFGNPDEDYDSDPGAGSGAEGARADPARGREEDRSAHHPLPASEEARHDEIPEHLEREKGRGDDSPAAVQPAAEAVAPDGESYERRRDGAR
jgi:hypothetical protein